MVTSRPPAPRPSPEAPRGVRDDCTPARHQPTRTAARDRRDRRSWRSPASACGTCSSARPAPPRCPSARRRRPRRPAPRPSPRRAPIPPPSPSPAEPSTAGSETGGIAGTWTVDPTVGSFDDFSGSFVGYRVQEELASVGATEAVGRTPDVTGTLTVDGTTITAAEFTADLTTLQSDEGNRDGSSGARAWRPAPTRRRRSRSPSRSSSGRCRPRARRSTRRPSAT